MNVEHYGTRRTYTIKAGSSSMEYRVESCGSSVSVKKHPDFKVASNDGGFVFHNIGAARLFIDGLKEALDMLEADSKNR